MIARWPGVIRPKTITHQVGHVIDFMPTLLEIAGGNYPAKRQGKPIPKTEGKSLLPIFQGKTRAGHDSLSWYLYGNRAVRQGKWKLVWGVTGKKWELYDMQADRTETVDLAKKYPQRVARMSDLWHEWAKRTQVPLKGSGL
jgi:arylsulfatase